VVLEVVVPVVNDQAVLDRGIRRIVAYLAANVSVPWQVTIVVNGATDATPLIARNLAIALPGVRTVEVRRRRRAVALRAAWASSTAELLAGVDISPTADLSALPELVAARGRADGERTRDLAPRWRPRSWSRDIRGGVF
jgi:glycosyltransferase involved in cell wall biosynthesis